MSQKLIRNGMALAGLVLMTVVGCQDSQAIKLKQYQAQGRALYLQHCSGCHQPNGEGLGELYPPVAFADYLLEDIPRAICITYKGLSEEIVVNGKSYNLPMPPNRQLTSLQIAEIMTYITTAWGDETDIITPQQVEKVNKSCRTILSKPALPTE